MYTINNLPDRFTTPFIRNLFQNDKRILFPTLLNDHFNNEKFFVVTKKNIYIPCELPSLPHEIGHAVEMKNKQRWLLPDFGMAFGANWKGHLPSVMFASIAREIRARAIGNIMLPGSSSDMRNHFFWGTEPQRFLPFGRFQTKAHIDAWMTALYEQTKREWNLDRIHHEWMIRFDHMREYMERDERKQS